MGEAHEGGGNPTRIEQTNGEYPVNDRATKNFAGSAIRLHANDNVVIARIDIAQGSAIPEENVTCLNRIPAGHK